MPSTTSRLYVARRADLHPSRGAAPGVLRNGWIDQIKRLLEAANLIQNVTGIIVGVSPKRRPGDIQLGDQLLNLRRLSESRG
jgi:hypothetical protein